MTEGQARKRDPRGGHVLVPSSWLHRGLQDSDKYISAANKIPGLWHFILLVWKDKDHISKEVRILMLV